MWLAPHRPRSIVGHGPGGGFRAKNLFAPRNRPFPAYSLSKSSYDFGIRDRMEFCCRCIALRLHVKGQVHHEFFKNHIVFFFCDQSQFKSVRRAHVIDCCQRIPARDRPMLIDFVDVHLPNFPNPENKSLMAALALLSDCLSISMATCRLPTCFATSFCTASGRSRRTSYAAASAAASA